jgi:hypothetical protein
MSKFYRIPVSGSGTSLVRGVSKTKTYENEDRRPKMGLRNYENEDPSLFSYYENEDPKIFIYIVFAKISVKV